MPIDLKDEIEVPVLIVGGSLVGLSNAIFLNWHGIDTLNVERHPSTAIHPRAGHFHLRTLELLRQVGVERAVIEASAEQFGAGGGIDAVESLAGKEIAHYISDLNEGVEAVSPSRRLFLAQQRLEPLLLARARNLGATLHYGMELVSFEQDAKGVSAKIRDLESGKVRSVRSAYMIAADGNRSPIRQMLGISMRGPGHLSNSITIYFSADLRPYIRGRDLGVIYVLNDKLRGFFRLEKEATSGFLVVNTLGDSRDPNFRDVADGITKDKCIEFMRSAVGVADLPVEILDIAPWRAVAENADRYSSGRVFLTGDAAHVMPPAGGFGGNTGIQDAHNLAWKLAAVLKGIASPQLLETYDAERRPIGALTIDQAYTRWVRRIDPDLGVENAPVPIEEMTMEIGYRYKVSDVATNGRASSLYSNPRLSPAHVGDRAPHIRLSFDGKSISSLDLFGRSFVLIAGRDGAPWVEASTAAANSVRMPLDAHCLLDGGRLIDVDHRFEDAYGTSSAGAALIRPDGYLAWQSGPLDVPNADLLKRVFAGTLCANP